ncbi:hypothetical protein [Lysinibacillus parviboronicapiens]|uniref:hypothetical protein n=1 Tax=Lysinibacillus parviboronicapiens TaxID=436516 RepID=UPI0006D05BBD|nr:hypothetical protein [Lysinibacillus parviboronicapiens]
MKGCAIFLEDSDEIVRQAKLIEDSSESIVVSIPLTGRERESVRLKSNDFVKPIFTLPWNNHENMLNEVKRTIKYFNPRLIIFKLGIWGQGECYFDPKGIELAEINNNQVKCIEEFANLNEIEIAFHPIRTPWLPIANYIKLLKNLRGLTSSKISIDLAEVMCDLKNLNLEQDSLSLKSISEVVDITWLESYRFDEAGIYMTCACTEIKEDVWLTYKKYFRNTLPILKTDRLSSDNQIINDLRKLNKIRGDLNGEIEKARHISTFKY